MVWWNGSGFLLQAGKRGLEEKFLSKGPETKKKKKPLCCAPHFRARTNLFQCAALRPVQAPDSEIQKRCHNAARTFSDLRKLPAVKESVLHGQLRLRQKRHGKICTDGRSDHHRQPLHALSMQKVLYLPYFVRLADIFLPPAVNGGGRQDAEISILQIPRNRFAARSCHTPIA